MLDVNDNSPVFTHDLYARKVVENVAVGTTVEVLRADDDDVGRNGDVRYKIMTGNEAGNVSCSSSSNNSKSNNKNNKKQQQRKQQQQQ